MKQLWLTLKIATFAMFALTISAQAEVNETSVEKAPSFLEDFLNQIITQERVALSAVTPDDFSRLTRRPSNSQGIDVYSRDYLSGLPNATGGKNWKCLTEALYFEARGETIIGQFAVAEVIMNRVSSGRFPDSVCGVIHQGTGKKFRCQFTYTCDGRKETVSDQSAWHVAGKISRLMLDGAPRNLTLGATHYHTHAVRPKWARVFKKTTTIGEHRFYIMPGATPTKS